MKQRPVSNSIMAISSVTFRSSLLSQNRVCKIFSVKIKWVICWVILEWCTLVRYLKLCHSSSATLNAQAALGHILLLRTLSSSSFCWTTQISQTQNCLQICQKCVKGTTDFSKEDKTPKGFKSSLPEIQGKIQLTFVAVKTWGAARKLKGPIIWEGILGKTLWVSL